MINQKKKKVARSKNLEFENDKNKSNHRIKTREFFNQRIKENNLNKRIKINKKAKERSRLWRE